MKLHAVIKTLREEKALTQEQLAEKSGLTRGYISRLESGDYADGSPSIRTLQKIAMGFTMPLEYILNKAGITKDDYLKSADTGTFLRAKYDFTTEQVQNVEVYIEHVKNQLKKK